MSDVFSCDDKDTLVAYLYGEVDPEVRRDIERHLRTCALCAREAEGLEAVRHDLQSWLPPEAELGFSIVQRPAAQIHRGAVATSTRWSSWRDIPAWAQVAAAMLFLGLGAAIANLQVRSTSDGFVVTTGWMQPAVTAGADQEAQGARLVANPVEGVQWRRELAALERTLRSEMQAHLVTTRAAVPARGADAGADSAAILRRVQAMIEASEDRQRKEIASRLIQAERTWNVRRQTDLGNIQRTVGSLQNRTIVVQANQQEVINQMNQLRRVGFTQPNQ